MSSGSPDSGAAEGAPEPDGRVSEPNGRVSEPSGRVSEASYLGSDRRPASTSERDLGDFTTTPSVLRLVPVSLLIGVLSSAVALGLLDMIGFITNILYYQHLSVHLVSPNNNTLGAIGIAIPVGGGLIVGLMARYGSDQIRGHGIPEAMENILINGSSVQPRLAILKPISSAVSIGTGGPFGAEGPIILTGGAVGSLVGQISRMTGVQRRALLVAGASAGMAAVFGTPVAATLFGVELLVFEFKPRSMVLIGLASAVADGLRIVMADHGLVLAQPLFATHLHGQLGGIVLLGAAGVGVATGIGAWIMTGAVYGFEDLFMKLTGRLHWMWWPMIGGLAIGIGGLIQPRALGVGYNTIHAELLARLGVGTLISLLVVKLLIWSFSLSSGTSGGILAPLLMMGAAIGALLGRVLPGASIGVWALLGMSGELAGVTRSPFTSIVFAFELTHDEGSLLALLICATVSHLVSVLLLKRSILTEKVARRGFHVMREYQVDPLEATFVREVMTAEPVALEREQTLAEVYDAIPEGSVQRRQRLYPVLDAESRLVGVLPFSRVLADRERASTTVAETMITPPEVAYPDEILRAVADRMVAFSIGALPVVARDDPQRMVGLITQFDLLAAREKLMVEERKAERVLSLPLLAVRAQRYDERLRSGGP